MKNIVYKTSFQTGNCGSCEVDLADEFGFIKYESDDNNTVVSTTPLCRECGRNYSSYSPRVYIEEHHTTPEWKEVRDFPVEELAAAVLTQVYKYEIEDMNGFRLRLDLGPLGHIIIAPPPYKGEQLGFTS